MLINWSFAPDNFATDYRSSTYYWAQTTHFNCLKFCIKLMHERDRIARSAVLGQGEMVSKLEEKRFRLDVRKTDVFYD